MLLAMDKADDKPLKQRELDFAANLAMGYELSDAYRRAYKAKRLPYDVVNNRASRLAREQRIVDRVALCVTELKLEQLDSLGKAYKDLIKGIDAAFDAKNYNAYFAGMRLRLQCQGLLKDNINITAEQRLTDAQLVDQLGSKDKELKAKLRLVVGSGDAYST